MAAPNRDWNMGGSNQDAAVSSFCTAASYASSTAAESVALSSFVMGKQCSTHSPLTFRRLGRDTNSPFFALDDPHILHQKAVIQDHAAHRPQLVGTGKSLF